MPRTRLDPRGRPGVLLRVVGPRRLWLLAALLGEGAFGCGDTSPPDPSPGRDAGPDLAPPAPAPDAATPDTRAGVDARPTPPADASAPPDTGAPADTAARADLGSGDTSGPPPPAGGLRFVGRVDTTDPAGPRYSWSGTTLLARFTGTSIGVRLRDGGNQFHVLVDGKAQPKLVASRGRDTYPIASGLAGGPHDLVIHRRTEALFGDTQVLGLLLEPGAMLLAPPAPAARRLELVGDSITCGYGNEGPNMSCPFTADTENHYDTYGAQAARALNAEAVTVAFSGKGMYRNIGGDTNETMPQLYERTLVSSAASRWSFAAWIPDAVVINLGTNDYARGDPGKPYADAYLAFVRRVRGSYPNAQIVCALGPMMSTAQVQSARTHIMTVVEAMRAGGDTRVSYLEFAMQDGSTGFGCDWHPSVATHRTMGDQLTAELRRLLGW